MPEAQPTADESQPAPNLDTEPKGPALPATPPAITLAADILIAAVRAWWAKQGQEAPDDASEVAAVAAAVTGVMLAKGETHFEPPMAVRQQFGRFRLANPAVVADATGAAVRVLIPASAGATHLPEVIGTTDDGECGVD